MRRSRAISIRTRLTAFSLFATLAPMGVALGVVARRDLRDIRNEMLSSSRLVSEVVGDHSASAMSFDDRTAAERTLDSLSKVNNVTAAALYDAAGRLFARYPRGHAAADLPPQLPPPPAATTQMRAGYVLVLQPVTYREARYGTLAVRVSTATLHERTHAYLASLGLLGLGALLAALALALMLERMVSRPLLALTGVARRIAETEDYSVHAAATGGDEIGLLGSAFNQMLREVDRRQKEALQAIQVRDDFLSVASHELKTPLTSLKLQVQSLIALPPAGLSEAGARRVRTSFEVLARQVARLERLIGNLLDVSRIAAGRMVLDCAEVDLAAVVRDVAAQFEPELGRRDCRLELHADAPVVGRWDAMRVDQVVSNLLANAIKYGAGQPIDVRVEAEGDVARVIVRDRGIGIAPEDQKRIFDRFERAVSLSYGGVGLGLYISRQIVLAHGGTVRVQSAPGEGSTFIVELPRGGG